MKPCLHLWRLRLPLCALILLFGSVVFAVELLTVKVPEFATRGGRAKLYCNYKLDDDASLYSLKWYKGDHQFYQYIPANPVKKTAFFLPGVEVDMESSECGSVVLQRLGFLTSGTYRCEVIAEAPVFHTKLGEGNLTVIDPPESAPMLEGGRPAYRVGDQVSINCSSLSSRPAATLEWYVNDQLVTEPDRLREYKTLEGAEGLETAVLGLTFVTSRHHFQERVMRLKCVARIATAYFQSQETSIKQVSTHVSNTIAEGRRHFPLGSGQLAERGKPGVVLLGLALSLASLLSSCLPLPLHHHHHHLHHHHHHHHHHTWIRASVVHTL